MDGPLDSSYASDNWSGLCPEALEALVAANQGSQPPYGADVWSEKARKEIQRLLDCDAAVFFVASGTAGNSLALAHLTQPYHSILCHGLSHILLDECGAPGFFGQGSGLRAISQSEDARIEGKDLETALLQPKDLRFQPPAALSLTQSTERGTLYTVPSLLALTATAKAQGLRIHMDGARLLQAAAALDASPSDLTWKAGVDVLTLGSTKIGGGLADAVVFFNPDLAQGFAHRLKQAGQVPAKYRLLTAPWVGLLETDAWRQHAARANAMAAELEVALMNCGISPYCPRQSNMVFVKFSDAVAKALHAEGWQFHVHSETGVARLVTGWDASSDRNRRFEEALMNIQTQCLNE
jgi:threonine aldolase